MPLRNKVIQLSPSSDCLALGSHISFLTVLYCFNQHFLYEVRAGIELLEL